MHLIPLVIRGVATHHVRKWAAEVLDPTVPPVAPVPGMALPPVAPQEPVAPVSVPEPVAPPAPIASEPVAPPAPVIPSAPAVAAPAPALVAPKPVALAAPIPAGQTIERPLALGVLPPSKAAPAATAPVATTPPAADAQPAAAPPAQGFFAGAKDKLINKSVDDHLGALIDGLNNVDQSPDNSWMSKASDVFSDWHNWIAPIGVLAAMFGGTVGKVIGGLALVGGGVDLYQRYKGVEGLGQTPEGQALIQQALTFKDAQGKPQPFGNIKQLTEAAPDQARALHDLSLLSKLGAKNMLIERVVHAGIEQGQKMGVEPATIINRLVTTQKLTQQQGQDMLKNLEASRARLAEQTAPAHG